VYVSPVCVDLCSENSRSCLKSFSMLRNYKPVFRDYGLIFRPVLVGCRTCQHVTDDTGYMSRSPQVCTITIEPSLDWPLWLWPIGGGTKTLADGALTAPQFWLKISVPPINISTTSGALLLPIPSGAWPKSLLQATPSGLMYKIRCHRIFVRTRELACTIWWVLI
jgi:hypothetical protein